MKRSLDTLPDDVLLLILSYLETARDIASLILSCRRLHALVKNEDGWRVFVRNRFSSLNLPQPRSGGPDWEELAESLTWQSRCWDRRSLSFRAFLPRSPQSSGPRGRHAPFQPVLDAHLSPDSHEELLVFGAGEDIIARRRRRVGSGAESTEQTTTWYRSHGHEFGFAPGYDDVRAISIVAQPSGGQNGDLAILAGRDNGYLSLLSAADDSFGNLIASFSPLHAAPSGAEAGEETITSQGTINSVDVLSGRNMFAATTKTSVLLYDLPQETPANVGPSTVFDLGRDVFDNKSMTLSNAKWIGDDLLALGLSGGKDPLRYLTVTPSGFTVDVAAKNADLEERFGVEYSRLCASSIQPLNASSITNGKANLLLSAWRDGTCRSVSSPLL
jgi:hypothetical protein